MSQSENEVIDSALGILYNRVYKTKDVIKDPEALRRYFTLNLGELRHEVFGAIFLNSQNQVINMETLFRGTLNHTCVYPREVIKAALAHNCAGVIFYHNHPGGSIEPSPADISLTKRLGNVLKLVDITVLDHIIIAGHQSFSMNEAGKMPTFDIVV